MTLNTQQLLYLVEVERTRSISQAASNLYMGQPNLSRVLRDMEAAVGFQIFERTRKGVHPTQMGERFLRHPRSYRCLTLTQRYLEERSIGQRMDAYIRECHPRQALEMLSGGTVEIAVIRYSQEYQAYFEEQAQERSLVLLRLSEERWFSLGIIPWPGNSRSLGKTWRTIRKFSTGTGSIPKRRRKTAFTPRTGCRSYSSWGAYPIATSGLKPCRKTFCTLPDWSRRRTYRRDRCIRMPYSISLSVRSLHWRADF